MGKESEDGKGIEPVYSLAGHTDTVTGISLSPDGSYLLSNGMDNTARIWDVRPFVAVSLRSSTFSLCRLSVNLRSAL